MLNHRNGIEATKKKSMQPPWVLFIRRQSDESLGHSGRGKTFKMGEKAIFLNKNYFAYRQVVVLST